MIKKILVSMFLIFVLGSNTEAGFPYSMTYTPSTGNTILADHINTSNNEHINNNIPESVDDYSNSDAEFQSTKTPSTSSKPVTLAEDLETLRHMIRDITGGTYWYSDSNEIANRNHLINGGMMVSQRGTSFTSATTPANSDDTYLVDRWILLSDGNDAVDVTRQSSGGGVSGNEPYIRLDVETVSKKFGILQVIESLNERSLRGSSVSLSFEAKVTNAAKLSDIRAVVLAWDSTGDVVTSDIVSAWNAEGTRPTLVANWTAENTDSDLGVTTSWVRYEIEDISLDTAATANVGVFIYQNDVATNDTAGIFLEVTNVQLVKGEIATGFEHREVATELTKCKRYYEEFNNAGLANYNFGAGTCQSATAARIHMQYEVEKRVAPSITVSAAGDFSVVKATGGAEDVTVFTLFGTSVSSVLGIITVAANLAAGDATRLFDDSGANARIYIDAEL